jgi:glycosyltransferase involved in cell wall biosynthesis
MISVVIPALNEEPSIKHTLDEIRRVFTENNISAYEIIVVDDGSSDKTGEIARKELAKVVRHPHNVGYGRSLKDGIKAASYDTIIITDADRTYPFDQAPLLLKEYTEHGFDMVVGARTGEHYRESFVKAPLRKILKFLVEFTAGRKIPDINSGLRVFSKQTILEYTNHLCDTFSFTTSMTLAYMMTGKFVKYVPIPYEKREGKTKVKLFRDSLRTLQYILQAINYYNPFKIFILFAFFCILCSFFGFLMAALMHLQSGFYLGVGGLLVSLLVVCFGLVADLLKQIMNK